MKTKYLLIGIILFVTPFFQAYSVSSVGNSGETEWQAKWITATQNQNESDTWLCFRKDIDIEAVPGTAIADIAVDSKYWLWINNKMVVFEGGLKRGPNPDDTYYDEVDITKYLRTGKNTIAVLVWYFGKDGFSHKSSGKAAMVFQCIAPGLRIISDKTWLSEIHPAYEHSQGEKPNFRLSESNVRFVAERDIPEWQNPDFNVKSYGFGSSAEMGVPPVSPWNRLVKRPIPQWKNYGIKDYLSTTTISGETVDTIICQLPYNAQITPCLKTEAEGGKEIIIYTDHYHGGGPANVRAEYITAKGIHEYESLGWMNGQKVIYLVPKGVKIISLSYRETGYDSEFAGSFECSDPFLNRIWEKARRTLYITMRDNYMDCPDRERAQWIGDAVNETGEAFYALDPGSSLLERKCMRELINWQRADSTLYAPVPAGNWNKELPSQSLTAVGYYGLWNYYINTGDIQTVQDLYDGVVKYLGKWRTNDKGTVITRYGEWSWGDWGDNIDLNLMLNSLYYLALKGTREMASALGKTDDSIKYENSMARIKESFNEQFWNGSEYRSPEYKGLTDDRGQALAVVSGLADKEKYPAIFEVLKKEEHASPYMEKYVMEALFIMGYEDYAIERTKKRFGEMVLNSDYSTLFEGWGIGPDGFGGGTSNHAWSGGSLTVLSQYLCGISPVDPGYKKFRIIPQPGHITNASAGIKTVSGSIKTSFISTNGNFTLNVSVPENTSAIIGIPDRNFSHIKVNDKIVWRSGTYLKQKDVSFVENYSPAHICFEVPAGEWVFTAE